MKKYWYATYRFRLGEKEITGRCAVESSDEFSPLIQMERQINKELSTGPEVDPEI